MFTLKPWLNDATELYHVKGLSAQRTLAILQEKGFDVSAQRLRRFLLRTNVLRIQSRAGGWSSAKRPSRICEHCRREYAPKSRTQRWCVDCCPTLKDGTRMMMYGISKSDYDMLLQRSNNACEICRVPFVSTPCIDHEHISGRVRGLLCHSCNLHLSWFDQVQNLSERVHTYLAM